MNQRESGRKIKTRKPIVAGLAVALVSLLIVVVACTQQSDWVAPVASSLISKNAAGYTEINAEQLASMLVSKDFTMVNVHIPFEGDIPGTELRIPFDEIADRLTELPDPDERIVLYCRSGSMSTAAAKTLTSLGYRNVLGLDGGMQAWAANGYALEGR